jgi:hypothetical protein
VGATVEIFLTTKGDTPQSTVGGQIIIKSPRIAQSARSFIDPSGCAVVAGIDIHIGSTDVRIISTYWPGSIHKGLPLTDSLWDKLQKFLMLRNEHMSPLEYIQSFLIKSQYQQQDMGFDILYQLFLPYKFQAPKTHKTSQ